MYFCLSFVNRKGNDDDESVEDDAHFEDEGHVEDDERVENEVIVISDSDDLLSDVAPVTATTFSSSDDSSSETEDLVQRCPLKCLE